MKHKLSIVVLIAFTATLFAQGLSSRSSQPNMMKVRSTSQKLTDEQISELFTELPADTQGNSYVLKTSFGPKRFSSREKTAMNKYKRAGSAPYRLTVTLYEVKNYRGKSLSKRLNGTVYFYIEDSEGNIVSKKKSQSLSKMCPG